MGEILGHLGWPQGPFHAAPTPPRCCICSGSGVQPELALQPPGQFRDRPAPRLKVTVDPGVGQGPFGCPELGLGCLSSPRCQLPCIVEPPPCRSPSSIRVAASLPRVWHELGLGTCASAERSSSCMLGSCSGATASGAILVCWPRQVPRRAVPLAALAASARRHVPEAQGGHLLSVSVQFEHLWSPARAGRARS